MARVSTEGIDDFVAEFQRIEDSMKGEAMKAILEAGAQPYVEQWKGSIEAHGHVRKGAMRDTVMMTEPKVDIDGASIEVYPQGQDSRGTRNALKAYVTHYGKGGRRTEKTGDKFVDEAERNADERSVQLMQEKLNEYINKE